MEILPMIRIRPLLATALMLLSTQTALAAGSRSDAIKLTARDCPATDEIPRDATCMRAMVPEDYDQPAGRTIGLDIVILRAKRGEGQGPPLFVFQGGPGDRTTLSAGDESDVWASFRSTHDLVFVDQRGNGNSPDLSCKLETVPSSSQVPELWPAALLAPCSRRLAYSADLARYTTTYAARDVDNVRAALGYAQIDVVGYSYGTRLAQELLRRNDAAIHAMLLVGPQSPAAAVPAGMAQVAQQALVKIVDRCKSDKACAAVWPDGAGDLERLQQRLAHGSFRLNSSGDNRGTEISPGVVASYLRMHLYSASGGVTIPGSIHALSDEHRDQAELLKVVDWRKNFDTWGPPLGMYMAITCAEDLPFIDVIAERRAAERTFLGSYRVDQQVAACRAWPKAQPNAAVHTPVVSSVPTLLLIGEFDVATPSRLVPIIAASLAHGRTIVVPNRGHSMPEKWDSCLGKVATVFLETADEKHLDTACIGQLQMPPFVTTTVPSN